MPARPMPKKEARLGKRWAWAPRDARGSGPSQSSWPRRRCSRRSAREHLRLLPRLGPPVGERGCKLASPLAHFVGFFAEFCSPSDLFASPQVIVLKMLNTGRAVSRAVLAFLAPGPPARRALRHTLPVGARAATVARADESFGSTAVRNGLKMGPQSVFCRLVVLAVVGAVCGAATSEDHYEHALDGRALSKVCVA